MKSIVTMVSELADEIGMDNAEANKLMVNAGKAEHAIMCYLNGSLLMDESKDSVVFYLKSCDAAMEYALSKLASFA